MTPAILTALGVVLGLGGIFAALLTMVPSPENTATKAPGRLQIRLQRMRTGVSRRTRILLLVGSVTGVVFWFATGWVIFIVAIPLAILGMPAIFSDQGEKTQTDKLEAIETWTRSLSGLIVTGTPLERALTSSLSNAKPEIYRDVSRLVARLEGRWPTMDALQAFADDLNDPTGDLVVMNLMLAAKQRGQGLVNALNDLAQTVFEEVRVRRQVTSDRSKPRWNARVVTGLTIGLLLAIPFMSAFSEPYKSPIGQIMFAGWLGIIALILVAMKQVVAARPIPRMLVNTGRRS
ncbi:pilus assembly protein TadB [Paenarthrobacter nitroguajacolicus]|uniref:type II secretion system F family protein n=1 Tax=Paenarthrobacter nitroguajacolicus TaxID=211146 RepID=UPI0015BA5A70|nr:type II secretion system F family protein [Paenarthrobacter nitroguajacolicus]NWL10366.1 pilus assembly protein TadB [Paenarthrobacter nitroguajacolicus]